MNIIFDINLVPELKNRYIVLELDTIWHEGMEQPLKLHAIIETVPVADLEILDELSANHAAMVGFYKAGVWDAVPPLVEKLKGHWQGELDSFYDLVLDFSIESAKLNRTWDGVRITTPVEDTDTSLVS